MYTEENVFLLKCVDYDQEIKSVLALSVLHIGVTLEQGQNHTAFKQSAK